MKYLTENDIDYLCDQSADNLNMVLYGMTSLMEDTQEKVDFLESQTWFQRMANTLTGKNKMTISEITENHELINVYMSEAISELYNRNCIDHDIILGLGNKLNDLLAEQIELKQMLGAFVDKLNQKIISIDNFHMLTTEINQGVYNNTNPIISICKITSKLDWRTVQDQRKMDILLRAMEEAGIINDSYVLVWELFSNILYASDSEAGVIAMVLGYIKDELLAGVLRKIIFEYYFLPEKVRETKKPEIIVKRVLQEEEIDLECMASSKEFYESLIEGIAEHVIQYEIQEMENMYAEKKQKIMDYFEQCNQFMIFLRDMADAWEPMHGEFNNTKNKESYFGFMNEMIDSLDPQSLMGHELMKNALNVDYFFQSLIRLYPILRVRDFSTDIKVEVNERGYLYLPDMTGKSPDGMQYTSLWGWLEDTLINPMKETKQIYSFNNNLGLSDPQDYKLLLLHDVGIAAYKKYYEILQNKTSEMIADCHSKLDLIYNIVEKYPLNFELQQFDSVYINHFESKDPQLVFRYEDWMGNNVNQVGYCQLGLSFEHDYIDKEIVIEVIGIDEAYTIFFNIVKNYVLGDIDANTLTASTYKYCNVRWGEKPGNNMHRLVISPLANGIGFLEIKIAVEGHPECCGKIES